MKTSEFPRMHVSLYVKDVNATTDFYQKFFELENPNLIISFVENETEVQPLFGHLGFQVGTVEELNLRLEAIKEFDMNTLEETGTSCCYAKQDKFWVTDPDGYRWEVYYVHEDVEWNDPKYNGTADACCSPAMVVEPVKKEETCCDPASGCC